MNHITRHYCLINYDRVALIAVGGIGETNPTPNPNPTRAVTCDDSAIRRPAIRSN